MDQEKWRDFYRKSNKSKTWVKVMLSDGQHYFFSNHLDWLCVKKECDEKNLKVAEMQLQFRSHCVTIDIDEDTEAVYLVPSVMGRVGMESKNYFTVGLIKKGVMYKNMWLIPELIIEKEFEDRISNCFTEALIYYEKTQENRES